MPKVTVTTTFVSNLKALALKWPRECEKSPNPLLGHYAHINEVQ